MLRNRNNSRSVAESFRSEDTLPARNLADLIAAAYPESAAPNTLHARISSLEATPVRTMTWAFWKPAFVTVLTLVVVGGLSFVRRKTGEPAEAVLAQTKAAMAGVTEFHSVILDVKGNKRGEVWYSRALGFRSQGGTGEGHAVGRRRWWIDDLHRTRFWDEAKKTVTIDCSDMGRPDEAARIARMHTGEGVLEQLSVERERAKLEKERAGRRPAIGTVELDVATVNKDRKTYSRLRSVRSVPFTKGPETWTDIFLIDPETDRIVETESLCEPAGTRLRSKIDYPRSLPRHLFRFNRPKGVRLIEWLPAKVVPDSGVEECLRNVRSLAIQLAPRGNKGPITRRQMLDSIRTDRTKIENMSDLRWCPADPRKGEVGYCSYDLASQAGVIFECKRHAGKIIRALESGRVTVQSVSAK
jgi:hypothetical protein